MDTVSCLLSYPWRTLTALGGVYHVSAHHHLDKKDVAQELSATIHARLSQTLASLSTDALAALRALTKTEDLAIPRSDFVTRFGRLSPYRPWAPDAPPAPWPEPPSPAAALVHYGLAYPLELRTGQHRLNVVLLPHDLRDAIAVYLDLSIPLPPPTPHADLQLADLQLANLPAEMFAFLSLLNRRDYPVRHGRWLPPRALKLLNQRLAPPDDLGAGRSELQAARIPFLHYLAERAGLVEVIGGFLKPTLLTERWLTASHSERLRALWDVWGERCDENRALWLRYRLPTLEEDDDPVARFHALLRPLAACPIGSLGCSTDLLDALVERNPTLLRPQTSYAAWVALDPDEQARFESRARAVLLELLTGPLVWFGLLKTAIERKDQAATPPPAPLFLTPLGAALLGRDEGAWPQDPPAAFLHIAPLLDRSSDGLAILIDAPPGLSLPDRFALEAIVPPDRDSPGRYHLTRQHFLRALQRSHSVAGVVNFLERASGRALSPIVLDALYRWADEFDRVAIRQMLLLQTRDEDLLQELTAQRRIRETLGQTLNARTVEVRADRLDALRRRLAHRDILPRLELPAEDSPAGREIGPVGEGERAAIVAALRIYTHLAHELGLPTRPAHALARRWGEGLSLPLQDAVKGRVNDVLEALHRAAPVGFEDRLPEPIGPLLDKLEAAIEEEAVIEIEYYTASRAHTTVRRVEPLRLEWRGDVAYLVAYCHLRGDQRTFRVDRIERIGE